MSRTPDSTQKFLGRRDVAALLGKSPSWFSRHLDELSRSGFPSRDKVLRTWHHQAVLDWISSRAPTQITPTTQKSTWRYGLIGKDKKSA